MSIRGYCRILSAEDDGTRGVKEKGVLRKAIRVPSQQKHRQFSRCSAIRLDRRIAHTRALCRVWQAMVVLTCPPLNIDTSHSTQAAVGNSARERVVLKGPSPSCNLFLSLRQYSRQKCVSWIGSHRFGQKFEHQSSRAHWAAVSCTRESQITSLPRWRSTTLLSWTPQHSPAACPPASTFPRGRMMCKAGPLFLHPFSLPTPPLLYCDTSPCTGPQYIRPRAVRPTSAP